MLGSGDVPASDKVGRSSSERIEECLECGDPSMLSLVDKGLEGRAVRPGLGASSLGAREAKSLFESDNAMIPSVQEEREQPLEEQQVVEILSGYRGVGLV